MASTRWPPNDSLTPGDGWARHLCQGTAKASSAPPTSHESCCPSLCQSLCLSQWFPSCCFSPGSPFVCHWGEGHFWENWWDWGGVGGREWHCGSRIHAIGWDKARLLDRDRQAYYQSSVFSSYPQGQGILRLGSKGWRSIYWLYLAVILTLFPQLSWLESASILLFQPSSAAAIGRFPTPSSCLLIIGLSCSSVWQRGLRHARQY